MELQPVEYPLQAKQHCVLSIASLKELIVFLKIPRPFEATGERLLELSAVFQSVPFSSYTLSDQAYDPRWNSPIETAFSSAVSAA